jgi:hypothetical protein
MSKLISIFNISGDVKVPSGISGDARTPSFFGFISILFHVALLETLWFCYFFVSIFVTIVSNLVLLIGCCFVCLFVFL